MASPQTEFLKGLGAVAPALLGTIPFAMIAGVAGSAAGLDASMTLAMFFIVFAGVSQIAASQLISADAPIAIIVLTAFVINLRFLMYSAYLAPYLKHLPWRSRALIGFFVTDTGFALSLARFNRREQPNAHWFFLGTGVGLWATWQIGGILGMVLGARFPAHWSMDFIIPLTFAAILAPLVRNRPAAAAVLASATTTVAAAGLPYKLGLVAAAFVGIGAGMLTESWTRRSSG